jgi:hypothetical protein
MTIEQAKWNPEGSVLALGGTMITSSPTTGDDLRPRSVVQFFSSTGEHLTTLKAPGSGVTAFDWEGSGGRSLCSEGGLVLAVDSFLYFCDITTGAGVDPRALAADPPVEAGVEAAGAEAAVGVQYVDLHQ